MRQTKISIEHLQAAAKLFRTARHYMQNKINRDPYYVDPLLDEVLDAVVDYEVAVNKSWKTMEDYAIHEGFFCKAGEPIDGDVYVEGFD